MHRRYEPTPGRNVPPSILASQRECPSRRVESMWSPHCVCDAEALRKQVCATDRSAPPWALLVDDGELEDVHSILRQFGTSTLRLRSRRDSSPLRGWVKPQRLLVVSGRRALSLGPPGGSTDRRCVTMAVLAEPSHTLRNRVKAMGFDYVVRRPVDLDALALLLRSVLYRGEERRCRPRFPVGRGVSLRTGWRRRPAHLSELSSRGCSLFVSRTVDGASRIRIRLPADLAGDRPLELKGQVIRSERRPLRSALVSVLFDREPRQHERLLGILTLLRAGPPPLPRYGFPA